MTKLLILIMALIYYVFLFPVALILNTFWQVMLIGSDSTDMAGVLLSFMILLTWPIFMMISPEQFMISVTDGLKPKT